MEHLISYCDAKVNLTRLELDVHSNNMAALGLCKPFGLETEGARPCWLKENESMYIHHIFRLPYRQAMEIIVYTVQLSVL